MEERLAHIAEAKRQYHTQIPWIADTMANDLKHALGDQNNSEFVVSPEGKIVIARSWSDPDALREDLEKLVGKADTLTKVSDLPQAEGTKEEGEKSIATGIVPRVPRPDGGVILQSGPVNQKEGEPLYVKLRVEADSPLLKGEKGTLHLGFHIDPIHHVHWNNLAPPLKYEITAPEGMTVMEMSGVAAKIEEADADRDPREFLIQVDPAGSRPTESLRVKVNYFACDDGDQWCKAASQTFEVRWQVDLDAGKVRAEGGGDRPGNGKGKGKGMRPAGSARPTAAEMMARLDRNKDGGISKEEARGPVEQRFTQIDVDKNGILSKEELETMFEQMRR